MQVLADGQPPATILSRMVEVPAEAIGRRGGQGHAEDGINLREVGTLQVEAQVFHLELRSAFVLGKGDQLIDHRAQLTVYLRLLDVPVPAVYGTTMRIGLSG